MCYAGLHHYTADHCNLSGSRCFASATPGGVCVYPVVLLSLAWGEGWHDDLHLLGESMDLRRHYDGAGVGFQALYVVELPTSSRIAFKHVLYNEDTDAL
jgi:hypothetical protein